MEFNEILHSLPSNLEQTSEKGLNSTLSNILHNIEEHLQLTNSYDRSKNLSQTNELLHKIKENLQTIKQSSINIPSMTDDWFITQSFVFPDHFSFSINLSEELMNCVKIEQKEYDKLFQDYQQSVDSLKQRDQEMSERLIIFNDFYEELAKMNQTNSIKDLLNSYMWNSLHKMTDELENLCYKMVDSKTRGHIES